MSPEGVGRAEDALEEGGPGAAVGGERGEVQDGSARGAAAVVGGGEGALGGRFAGGGGVDGAGVWSGGDAGRRPVAACGEEGRGRLGGNLISCGLAFAVRGGSAVSLRYAAPAAAAWL